MPTTGRIRDSQIVSFSSNARLTFNVMCVMYGSIRLIGSRRVEVKDEGGRERKRIEIWEGKRNEIDLRCFENGILEVFFFHFI